MKPLKRFKIKIDKGKVQLNRESFNKHCNELEDGYYNLFIEKYRKYRSLNQNRYYWGVVLETYAEASGSTPEEAHDYLGYRFLTTSYECPISQEMIQKTKSTTKLNTKEMEEYMEMCRRDCLESYNVVIPLPHETRFNY